MENTQAYAAYLQYRQALADDAQLQQELESIREDPREIEDRFYTELSFGTAGMRGVLGAGLNRMNVYNIRRATAGLADYLHQVGEADRSVVIAYDSRHMSPEFALSAALVLAQNGITVNLFPSLRPVPVLSFAVRYLQAAAGIVITASHNPPEYNGYKVYWDDGAQLPPERADAVLACITKRTYETSVEMPKEEALENGLLRYVDSAVDDAYIDAVKTLALEPALLHEHGKDLRIVYTPLHGSGYKPIRRVLEEMGVTNLLIVPEQRDPDPDFSTVKVPNPQEAETFTLAIALANRERADVCFATDPDCDRLGVAMRAPDGSFVVLTGNQIGCLLLHHILTTRARMGTLPANGAAVKSIVSTELARDIATDFGVAMVDTLTGFKFIAEQIQQFEETGAHTFLFGFEESYGYLSSTFVRDKDAVNASLLVTELALSLRQQGQTLQDRMDEIYRRYGYAVDNTTAYTLPGKDGLERMQAIMQGLREHPPREVAGLGVLAVRDYLTGIRTDSAGAVQDMGMTPSDVLYYELEQRCWICVRPSGTEPKIKLYVSTRGDSQQAADVLAARIEGAAKELLS